MNNSNSISWGCGMCCNLGKGSEIPGKIYHLLNGIPSLKKRTSNPPFPTKNASPCAALSSKIFWEDCVHTPVRPWFRENFGGFCTLKMPILWRRSRQFFLQFYSILEDMYCTLKEYILMTTVKKIICSRDFWDKRIPVDPFSHRCRFVPQTLICCVGVKSP